MGNSLAQANIQSFWTKHMDILSVTTKQISLWLYYKAYATTISKHRTVVLVSNGIYVDSSTRMMVTQWTMKSLILSVICIQFVIKLVDIWDSSTIHCFCTAVEDKCWQQHVDFSTNKLHKLLLNIRFMGMMAQEIFVNFNTKSMALVQETNEYVVCNHKTAQSLIWLQSEC